MKKSLTIKNVLVFYDEPQVVLLEGAKKIHSIAVAVEKEGMEYPFFCCEIYKRDWLKYLNQKADLYFLFNNALNGKYYFFDWNDQRDGKVNVSTATAEERSNLDFWPERGFFAANHTEVLAGENEQSRAIQTFEIDGSWAAVDFSAFYAKMADLYGLAFIDQLLEDNAKSEETEISLKSSILSKLWRGGGSYVGFYSDLMKTIEDMVPLNVKKIQYASPGTIEFSGNQDVFNEMMRYLNEFSENLKDSSECYKRIDTVLSREKLKKADPESSFSSSAMESYVKKNSDELIRLVGIGREENFFNACGKNYVVYAKLCLSIHRRLKGIYDFYSEGRVANAETIEFAPSH
ncbi:hypothetical protein [Thalassospira povalilytica]|uniref:hypothetical protein n=1 Tax=Thalassospira povalilytica TaxID=732237 RepID=UPI001D18241E|nr:hypothetical protein [Thalassospira povalilytica]MCC4241005.1 hypothetical protein [Thalassospira povalilytica]